MFLLSAFRIIIQKWIKIFERKKERPTEAGLSILRFKLN